MLLTCTRTELIKLRRSFIWLACFIIPILPSVMGTGNYLANLDVVGVGWYPLWTQATLFYGFFFFAPLISIYCAFLWRLENFGSNRNALMTAPVPLSCVFFGKLAVTALVTLITQLWVYFLFFLCGKYCGLPGLPPIRLFFWCMRGALGGMVIAAAMLLFSMCIRSFALPIGFSLVMAVIGVLFSNQGSGLYFPFSLICYGMNSNTDSDLLSGNMLPFFASCLLYLALFSAAAIHLLRTRDVKA